LATKSKSPFYGAVFMNARIDMDSLLAELNPEQLSAVTHLSGPLLVLAGAGTGKTRVITLRIANLLSHDIEPSRIVAVSFTKKAGNEMKERLTGLIGTAAKTMQVSTFHSLGWLVDYSRVSQRARFTTQL
jgi:ATP-dependent exoDNAse (exonuclease V) beta subunit